MLPRPAHVAASALGLLPFSPPLTSPEPTSTRPEQLCPAGVERDGQNGGAAEPRQREHLRVVRCRLPGWMVHVLGSLPTLQAGVLAAAMCAREHDTLGTLLPALVTLF